MPPPRRASGPNVGLRLTPRLAAAIRFARAFSSSPFEGGVGSLGAAASVGGADSPRARRRASMYEARSAGGAADGAGVGAGAGGAAGTRGSVAGAVGVGSLRAITGGGGGARGRSTDFLGGGGGGGGTGLGGV